MITDDIKYHYIQDLASKNELLCLEFKSKAMLCAGVWTALVHEKLSITMLACLEHAVNKIITAWPEWEMWLLATQKMSQRDNRVTRYYKLWESLKVGGSTLPNGEYLDEIVLPFEGGIRTYSAVRFNIGQLKLVHDLRSAIQSAIVFLPKEFARQKIKEIIEQGWNLSWQKPPEEILQVICSGPGVIIDTWGSFDDRDVAVAAIGQKGILDAFAG